MKHFYSWSVSSISETKQVLRIHSLWFVSLHQYRFCEAFYKPLSFSMLVGLERHMAWKQHANVSFHCGNILIEIVNIWYFSVENA